jgi:hypothetical protein
VEEEGAFSKEEDADGKDGKDLEDSKDLVSTMAEQ